MMGQMDRRNRIYARADGGAAIGAGHLMRLLTYTDVLKKEADITYLCADEESADLVRERGYEVNVFHTDPKRMEEELPLLRDFFEKREQTLSGTQSHFGLREKKPVMLVDSYFVTPRYLQAVSEYVRVLLLDDTETEVFPADGILNYNAFVDRAFYEKHYPGKKLFLGPEYVPLRPQFAQTGQGGTREGILITTGGGDRDNIAGQILSAIWESGQIYHVVAGPFSPNYETLRETARRQEGIVLHEKVENMAELMRHCSLAVTASGTTVYELCSLSVPFVCFAYARNQEKLARFVGKEKIGYDAGDFHKDSEDTLQRIRDAVKLLQRDAEAAKCGERAGKRIDAGGAWRFASQLLLWQERGR